MALDPTRFDELLRLASRSAVHLEMRDGYMRSDPAFIQWQAGEVIDPAALWPQWYELLGEAVARSVAIRRARIVSEPLSDYVAFEHTITEALNIAAGEDVRWLPRRQATDLALPGNDFWLFDNQLVLVNHFNGDGEATEPELLDDPAVAKLCATAFEAVWERGVPHAAYAPAR
ncbi:DUF6879 family protein [Kitasatospora sp. NPDC092039]|uniref:DUF6879 family protein n=1 Tax=Kitasatospora sp. NPDC092039 TaxID=3364086 RepID=UPI00380EAED6